MRPLKILAALHAVPLIRRMRFRHEVRDTGGDFRIAALDFLADSGNRFGHLDDPVQVDRTFTR